MASDLHNKDLAAQAAYEASVALVAERSGVSPATLRRPSRRALPLLRLRRSAAYLAVTSFNQSRRAIARAASLSPEAVARACRQIEVERELADIDQFFTTLEEEIAR